MEKRLCLAIFILCICPVCALAQSGTPSWAVQVLQVSRPESLLHVDYMYDDHNLDRIERYGPEGTKWVQVTVNVKLPASSNSVPVKQITLDGHPLLAIAYKAKPSHSTVFQFISAFDSYYEESKKQKERSKEYKDIKTSGTWGYVQSEFKNDSGKLESGRGRCFFVEHDIKQMIMCIARGKETSEVELEFKEKGLERALKRFGKMQPINIILLFAAPGDAKDFKLTFGDAIVPVQLTQ